MTLGALDLQALAREIAARMAPDALLDVEDAAALLKCEPRYFSEEISKAPGFPAAIRLPRKGGGRGHPRWKRADVIEYAHAHQDQVLKKPGRPRRVVTL